MARDRHANGGQGRKWIRDPKRLAIMLRDGMACCYCSIGVEDGEVMTLDHVIPHSHGGGNTADNLIMACRRCNSARGKRSIEEFAEKVAGYLNHDVTAAAIIDHIHTTRQRSLDMAAAKALIAARGNFSAVLRSWEQA